MKLLTSKCIIPFIYDFPPEESEEGRPVYYVSSSSVRSLMYLSQPLFDQV